MQSLEVEKAAVTNLYYSQEGFRGIITFRGLDVNTDKVTLIYPKNSLKDTGCFFMAMRKYHSLLIKDPFNEIKKANFELRHITVPLNLSTRQILKRIFLKKRSNKR